MSSSDDAAITWPAPYPQLDAEPYWAAANTDEAQDQDQEPAAQEPAAEAPETASTAGVVELEEGEPARDFIPALLPEEQEPRK